uniref:Uncharacterized protein n=1 Tax=viral metagenome TaxID=1070528 RepID=A0A6M3JDP6_9ZZZZ
MSKMGNKLERLLDENKYELLAVLRNLVERIDNGLALGEKLDVEPARKVLSKIENNKGGS